MLCLEVRRKRRVEESRGEESSGEESSGEESRGEWLSSILVGCFYN